MNYSSEFHRSKNTSGTSPGVTAEASSTRRTIGLAIDTIGAYGREVIHGVMNYCASRPTWIAEVWSSNLEGTPFTQSPNWNVDGLIVQAYNQDTIDRIESMNRPTVNVANMGGKSTFPTVVPDDGMVARLAANHLLSLRVANFGFCGHSSSAYSRLRADAFRAELKKANIDVLECDNAKTDLLPWIQAVPKPIAIFCCNDFWAHQTLSACRRCDLIVPDDVAILGVDDDELINATGNVPLSTISIQASTVGWTAAQLLESMFNRMLPPLMTTIPPLAVIPRISTLASVIDDPDVAMALRYIKSRIIEPISVAEVVDKVAIGRRSLERRFRAALGHSIDREIHRTRIEAAKIALLRQNVSVEEAARLSGFSSASLLGVHFRRYVGLSPRKFQRRERPNV